MATINVALKSFIYETVIICCGVTAAESKPEISQSLFSIHF